MGASLHQEGWAGLADRSSRPHRCPQRTAPTVEETVIALRRSNRRGQDWIGAKLGAPARTVSTILRRHQPPYLCECDPSTGMLIRTSKITAVRYERSRPGELVHLNIKRLAASPAGAAGKRMAKAPLTASHKRARIGLDYVRSAVDDYSRLAYSDVLPKSPQSSPPSAPRRVHPPALPMAKRKSRAIQPDAASRMGLPTGVHYQRCPHLGTCTMARALQHSTTSQRARRPPTDQPPATNLMTGAPSRGPNVAVSKDLGEIRSRLTWVAPEMSSGGAARPTEVPQK